MADEGEAREGAETSLAPVTTSALRPAASLESARPGELIFLDRRGRVVSPRRVTAIKAGSWAILVSSWTAVGAIYASLWGPTAGVLVALAVASVTGARLRHWPEFRAAAALLAAYRWEDAYAAFEALDGKRLVHRHFRRAARVNLSGLELLLGTPEKALARVDKVLAELRGDGGTNASAKLAWFRATGIRAIALARLGRSEDARRQRDALVAARDEENRMYRGEYFVFLLQDLELTLAFEADAPESLPDDATLHEWARAALLRTQFGETLVKLSWAFHRRGDDDMARHLLAESPSRTPRPSPPQAAPRLHAWVEERRAAWGLASPEACV